MYLVRHMRGTASELGLIIAAAQRLFPRADRFYLPTRPRPCELLSTNLITSF